MAEAEAIRRRHVEFFGLRFCCRLRQAAALPHRRRSPVRPLPRHKGACPHVQRLRGRLAP